MKKKVVIDILKGLAVLILLNVVANYAYKRFDLTEDKRFTISPEAHEILSTFNSPVIVDVLLDGKLPAEFSRLQTETVLLLEQFALKNNNIKFNLVNPLEGSASREQALSLYTHLTLPTILLV